MSKPFLSLAARAAGWLPQPVKRALYRLGPLSSGLRTLLNRAAPAGITKVEISGGDLRGLRMALDLQSEKDCWLGTYEMDLQAAIRAWVQPGWTAYDLGANIGYISLLLARAVGPQGHVLAIEALPQNVVRLLENVALNRLDGVVEVLPAAVSGRSGPVQFLVGPSDDTGKAAGSAGRDFDYAQTIEVPGISLDEEIYVRGRPLPQAVKMDLEGGEVLALPGMQRLLADGRPLLFVELHGQSAAEAAWEALTSAGYRICRMSSGYPVIASLTELDWKAYLVGIPQEFDHGRG